MTFEQWMTIAALITGPLGVYLGWWLNGRGATRQADEAARVADAVSQREERSGLPTKREDSPTSVAR